MKSNYLARVGVIAAAYAACTLIALLFLGSLAWGPIQFRVSEALCVLALFTPAAIPGLTLGCVIANVMNIVISGTGMLGMLDVVRWPPLRVPFLRGRCAAIPSWHLPAPCLQTR